MHSGQGFAEWQPNKYHNILEFSKGASILSEQALWSLNTWLPPRQYGITVLKGPLTSLLVS